jgi:LemA protein
MVIIIAAIAIPLIIIVLMYNSLVRSKNDVENAFGGMDVQLKKRYDLIPNLVETVKQYAGHEKELLENVTKLRAKVTDGQLSSDEKVALDNQISKSIGGIMVAVENYPDLKASENFINLQRTLNEVESQISASRRAYNASVTDYNNAVETFPKNIMAGMMNYKRKEVFVIQEVERQNVDVSKLF